VARSGYAADVRRCDAIIRTGFLFALLGAVGGVVKAADATQMLVYAALGVWGGALVGALLGALLCLVVRERRENASGARSDLRLEAPQKLRPARL
jgi:hypothetical protein